MDNNIVEIDELIKQFSKLPGLGPKSAKRIILKLINNKDSMIKPLAKSLASVYKKVVRCSNCGNLRIIDKCDRVRDLHRAALHQSPQNPTPSPAAWLLRYISIFWCVEVRSALRQ